MPSPIGIPLYSPDSSSPHLAGSMSLHEGVVDGLGGRSVRSILSLGRGRVRTRSGHPPTHHHSLPAEVDDQVDVQPKRARQRELKVDLGNSPRPTTVNLRCLSPGLRRRFAYLYSEVE